MNNISCKSFGTAITRLIQGENLDKDESRKLFDEILNDSQTEMQQGAFLAALAAKGETSDEIVGCWNAIYQLDTVKIKPNISEPLTDNCGTGMDSFKTFNISTAAAIIAAAAGVVMARHGARAITSSCGTVDILEILGIDVDCEPAVVQKSIEEAGIGIFNGMSNQIHPRSLGRILSRLSFGTVLNIAASLANPVLPTYGVRGVYSESLLHNVPQVMRKVGYEKAIVVCGLTGSGTHRMDEASTLGKTLCAELNSDGSVLYMSFYPEDLGISRGDPDDLKPSADIDTEARRMVDLLTGEESRSRMDIACLNAGLILYITGTVPGIREGYHLSLETIHSGRAIAKLSEWVNVQSLSCFSSLGG